ncbi:hypothetical protein DY000_02050010 [Brassica cretica]|uniref:Uncharacterized protein n=1 Tax=Brassica cretica TaxID=69181 RepID=A0ABQ7EYT7_BRACR|nr:hypothetical protein DY000_02050010 [Brassica cretica]
MVQQLFIGTSTVERITLILPNTFSTLFGLVLSKYSLYGCHNAYGVYVSSHIFPARIHIFTSVGFSSSTMGALRTRHLMRLMGSKQEERTPLAP